MANQGIYTNTQWVHGVEFTAPQGNPLVLSGLYECDIINRGAPSTPIFTFKSSDGTLDHALQAAGKLTLRATTIQHQSVAAGNYRLHMRRVDSGVDLWASEGEILIGKPGDFETFIRFASATDGSTAASYGVALGGPAGPVDTTTSAALSTHIANISNPHVVTKAQVGLGNVPNVADFKTVALLLSDATLTYPSSVSGDVVKAEGFRYTVAASGATDHHVTTAGGVKLYILASPGNAIHFLATGAVAGGVNHNTHWAIAVAAASMATAGEIVFPPGEFRISYTGSSIVTHIPANTTIRGAQWLTIIKPVVMTDRAVFGVNSGSASSQIAGITIDGITFRGVEAAPTFSEQCHLLSLNGVENAVVTRCAFIGFRGDGLYIGSGDAGGTERHNKNVRVDGCLFDGINKDNRNGISIIDCDGFNISHNTFRNCTKSTMPGAVDVEPDGNIYHVIKNGNITHNQFSNVGGNVGAIAFVLSAATFTTQPENFNIHSNTFDGVVDAVAFVSNAAYTNPINLSVVGNTGNCNRPWNFGTSINGFEVIGNTFRTGDTALLGFNVTDTSSNGIVANNNLKGPGTTKAGIVMRSGSGVVFSGNVLSGFHDYAILIGGSGSTVSSVNINGNHFGSITGTGLAVSGGGGISGNTCAFLGNTGVALHTFPAWRTDNCGGVINGDTSPSSFNADNLPDDFPVGECTSVINGDTAVPTGTGGNQGTLINYKLAATAGYEKFQWQEYYHANNTLKLGSYFIRRRNNASNTWTAWTEQAS